MTQVSTTLLHELFWASVARTPDAVAVDVPPGAGRPERLEVSYRELACQVEGLRARIQPWVERECIVAVLLPRVGTELYAAQIAVLSAGGAFVAPDVGFPADHLEFILRDSGAIAVVTDSAGAERLANMDAPPRVLVVDEVERSAALPRTPTLAAWLTPSSLAYVIYTSGTTGRPKGVMVEHGSIHRLIVDDQSALGMTVADRCAQNSTSAFDSSVEEFWVPIAAGATVVVVDAQTIRLGPDLVEWLRRERVSLLMPTPTLLQMMHCADPATELPDLRLIYIGGEAVLAELVEQWLPGRRMINGYGPTECTVTVTRSELKVGEAVTIGGPVDGSVAHVLDQDLHPVAEGAEGELCIGGASLARGYLGRPELTAEKFVEHPEFGRIYRTGDLVCRDGAGQLVYRGRIDTQVKLRGYRIELEAIEVRVPALVPEVRSTACRVQGEGPDGFLIAYLVADDSARIVRPEDGAVRSVLAESLPAFMVPDRLVWVDELPMTVSGKLDRKALPAVETEPGGSASSVGGEGDDWSDALEGAIGSAVRVAVGAAAPRDADFFELGGTSLRAAQVITALRQNEATAGLNVRDIYELRTVRRLADAVRARQGSGDHDVGGATAAAGGPESDGHRLPPVEGVARPQVVTAIQGLWLLALLVGGTWLAWFGLFVVLPYLVTHATLFGVVLGAPVLLGFLGLLYVPLSVVFVAAVKRVLIGRYRTLRTPVWSGFYLRHWLVVRCAQLVPWGMLQGTVFFNAALRALGADIGRRVHIHRGVDLQHGGWDLLTLGDDVTLSQESMLGLTELVGGHLVVQPVVIEAGATLEVRAGVGGSTRVGAGAELTALSALPAGGSIPAGERWLGVPAQRVGAADSRPVREPDMAPWKHGIGLIALGTVHGFVVSLPFSALVLGLLAQLPMADDVALDSLFRAFESPATCLVLLGVLALALPMSLLTRALWLRWTPDVPDGEHGRYSPIYWRIWLRTHHLERAGNWLAGSLYWRWWLQLSGMRLGANGEISTIIDVLPENVSIGEQTFFADGIYVAGPRVRRGVVTTAATSLGKHTFLGNHAVIPAGVHMPDDILLGVCTVADDREMTTGTSWFGHPVFELPRREIVAMDRTLTHDPEWWRYAHRLAWETLRFALPVVAAAIGLWWLTATARSTGDQVAWSWVDLPLLSFGAGALAVVFAWLCKWALIGRVKPGTHGLWSSWCCRWDFVYVAWDKIGRAGLAQLAGTLWLGMVLRAFGVGIGKRVILNDAFAQVVDPDMLRFDDGATVDCLFQAHSFEDRVLKIDRVRIGAGATARRAAVLMYGANLGAGSEVLPHSVVMKEEHLNANCRYLGVPTQRVR